MASTFTDLCVHVVFAVRGRQALIGKEWRDRFHNYLGGTVRGLGAIPLAVGGVEDHVHLVLVVRADQRISDLVREAKKSGTAWVRAHAGCSNFSWQEGYSAFSVGAREREAVISYVRSQEEHHRAVSSQDELRSLLKSHGIELDERYFS